MSGSSSDIRDDVVVRVWDVSMSWIVDEDAVALSLNVLGEGRIAGGGESGRLIMGWPGEG
jgi:hypothetical protein